MATRLRIDILGPRPSEVDIEDLACILDEFKKAVTGCLDSDPAAAADEVGARVSLVGTVEGSDGLVFEVQPRAAAAFGRPSRALRSRSYAGGSQAAPSGLASGAQPRAVPRFTRDRGFHPAGKAGPQHRAFDADTDTA